MNSRLVLSVILLLVATIVISTGFTASATDDGGPLPNPDRLANSTQNQWTQTYQQYYQQQTLCLCNPNDPNCSCRPNYPNYPYHQNYPGYPNYPNYGNYANYPCLCDPNDPNCLCRPNYPNYPYSPNYPNYGNYPYYYSNPSYGYGVVTETVTATNYSFVTQTNEVTSIASPVTVTASATVTTTSTTSDTTAETLYSTLMAVFLALFLATLVLLVGSRYRGSKGSNPQSPQAVSARPAQARIATSYKCSACGTDVDLGSKFCGSCGAQLKPK
jgi:hypothetical protein